MMLKTQSQVFRLSCLGANSDLQSLSTMSELQKAKSTNTYLMAASSDAPHGPLLFPNSAKIFGISWDMQALGSLSNSFPPLFSILQHYVDVDVSEACPLQAASTSLFDIENLLLRFYVLRRSPFRWERFPYLTFHHHPSSF